MKLCESMEFESADGDLNANVEKTPISSQTTDGIVKWIVLRSFMIQPPPFRKIKHVLKCQVCNCGLLSDRWAPAPLVMLLFECS